MRAGIDGGTTRSSNPSLRQSARDQGQPTHPSYSQGHSLHQEGQKPEKASKNCSVGLLSTARDWAMTVDLERQLKIPTHITQSKLRPDIILVSEATKQLILLELTVPWEERMEEAQERKREKYQELMEDCRRNGWRTRCMPVEVGSRGFASHSLSKAYGTLGITGANRRRAIGNNVEAAEKASRWLWLKRGEQWGQYNATWTQAGV